METAYIYRINIIAPEADKDALNLLWTLFGPEGDSEINTFGVPLSADGNEPATHRGISTAATEAMRLFIVDVFADELAGCVVTVDDYTLNDWDTLLQAQGLQAAAPEEL